MFSPLGNTSGKTHKSHTNQFYILCKYIINIINLITYNINIATHNNHLNIEVPAGTGAGAGAGVGAAGAGAGAGFGFEA